MPTRSCSSRMGRSSSAARIPSCWRAAGNIAPSTICKSGPRPTRQRWREHEMTTAEDIEIEEEDKSRRPSKAVVGSHREEEEVFGKAIDPQVMRRMWAFVRPYRRQIYLSVAAVLLFTFTQLAIPLIIRFAIDRGMAVGADGVVL